MTWFKPASLLDRFYEVGLFFKGLDGTLEVIAGALLLFLQPGTILNWAHALTRSELAENPHNYIAVHILHAGSSLAHGHSGFAVAFLLIHGLVKVGLVICLLLNKLWAYPLGLAVLGLLLLYQIYQLLVAPTFGMAFLTVVDVAILWLIWREWRHHRPSRTALPSSA